MKTLQTPREIVQALEGPSALAARLGIGRTAVQNWLASGYIPVHAADAIRAALREIEARCPDDIFRPRLMLRPRPESNNSVHI